MAVAELNEDTQDQICDFLENLQLLKPLNLPANYVLNLIIYITNPIINIGY